MRMQPILVGLLILGTFVIGSISVLALTKSSGGIPSFHQVKGVVDLSKPKPKQETNAAGDPLYKSNKGFKGTVTSPRGVINLRNPQVAVADKARTAALDAYRKSRTAPGKYQNLVELAKNQSVAKRKR